jgi:hypothetical protein
MKARYASRRAKSNNEAIFRKIVRHIQTNKGKEKGKNRKWKGKKMKASSL